jgi:V8-like Glu-specific endopeptidase
MTNSHVIGTEEEASQCVFEFNYQLDRLGKAQPVHTARPLAGGMFHTSPMAAHNATPDELDYTIVQIIDPPKGVAPLLLTPTAVKRESRVAVIQHPGGDYKKISLQNNFVEYCDEHVVQYTTTTEPGSSGSPVLNDNFEVVALHHAGGNLSEPTTKRRYMRNEGIRVSAIMNEMRRKALKVHELFAGA